jgi:hypothetical protein
LGSHFSPISITPLSNVPSILNRKSKRAALNSFIHLMRPDHVDRSLLVTHSYNQLSKGSKKNFLSSTQFVIDAVLEFLAGNDANQVWEELSLKKSSKLVSHLICRCNNNE